MRVFGGGGQATHVFVAAEQPLGAAQLPSQHCCPNPPQLGAEHLPLALQLNPGTMHAVLPGQQAWSTPPQFLASTKRPILGGGGVPGGVGEGSPGGGVADAHAAKTWPAAHAVPL